MRGKGRKGQTTLGGETCAESWKGLAVPSKQADTEWLLSFQVCTCLWNSLKHFLGGTPPTCSEWEFPLSLLKLVPWWFYYSFPGNVIVGLSWLSVPEEMKTHSIPNSRRMDRNHSEKYHKPIFSIVWHKFFSLLVLFMKYSKWISIKPKTTSQSTFKSVKNVISSF